MKNNDTKSGMRFIQTVLRGIGQVMFQNNMYSGLLFLVGIFYNSWIMGLAALCGTILSTYTAEILKYSKEDIRNGLYGFNGALTGIAVFCFFEVNLATSLALFVGSILSTVLMRFLKNRIPPFTAPFVMVSWFLIYFLVLIAKFPLLASSPSTENSFNLFMASSSSFGQVMFQENVVTGLIFLLAIFINNRLMAIYALYAAVLGSIFGWLFSESNSTINAGLMGYNAILCAIALTGKKITDWVWITGAILLSTLLNIGLARTGIITLTAPFVLATWVILILKNEKFCSKIKIG